MTGIKREDRRRAKTVQPLFNTVAMDITSFCNLKCPFCLSSHAGPNVFMTEEVFDKAISLIPLVENNNFLFSCLYEPTLHPDFLAYIHKIPLEYGHKVFFTTNLAKRMPDEVFRGLSTSGLHHINISIDSLIPPLYEKFRKGARFAVFHDNLTRLVEIFSAASNPPDIYYISLVNKLNYLEMPDLLEQCFTRYRGAFHEIREYWLLTHQRELDWCVENKLSPSELELFRKSLAVLSYNFSFVEAGRDLGAKLPDHNYRGEDVIDEAGWRDNLYHNPYEQPGIRIHADGKVEVLGRNNYLYLQDIAAPISFMSDLYTFLRRDMEKTDEMQSLAGKLILQALKVQPGKQVRYSIDEVLYNPKTLKLRGWCFHRDGRELVLGLAIPGVSEVELTYTPLKSPDVEVAYGKAAAKCRFEVKVNLNYQYPPDKLTGTILTIAPRGKAGKTFSLHDVLLQKVYKGVRNYFC